MWIFSGLRRVSAVLSQRGLGSVSLLTVSASWSEQEGSAAFTASETAGRGGAAAKGPAPRGWGSRNQVSADTTPLATPDASVVLASLSRVPPRVTSFHTGPGQDGGLRFH